MKKLVYLLQNFFYFDLILHLFIFIYHNFIILFAFGNRIVLNCFNIIQNDII